MSLQNIAIDVLVAVVTVVALVGTLVLLGLKIDVPSQVYGWDETLVGGFLIALGIRGGISIGKP